MTDMINEGGQTTQEEGFNIDEDIMFDDERNMSTIHR